MLPVAPDVRESSSLRQFVGLTCSDGRRIASVATNQPPRNRPALMHARVFWRFVAREMRTGQSARSLLLGACQLDSSNGRIRASRSYALPNFKRGPYTGRCFPPRIAIRQERASQQRPQHSVSHCHRPVYLFPPCPAPRSSCPLWQLLKPRPVVVNNY